MHLSARIVTNPFTMPHCLESAPRIDIALLKRHGLLDGTQHKLQKSLPDAKGEVYEITIEGNVVSVACTGRYHVAHFRFSIEYLHLKYGIRSYFICPATLKRVSHIYYAGGRWGSRFQHDLQYGSRLSAEKAQLAKASRAVEALKGESGRPIARGRRRAAALTTLGTTQQVWANALQVDRRSRLSPRKLAQLKKWKGFGTLYDGGETESGLRGGLTSSSQEEVAVILADEIEAVQKGHWEPTRQIDSQASTRSKFKDQFASLRIDALEALGLFGCRETTCLPLEWAAPFNGGVDRVLLAFLPHSRKPGLLLRICRGSAQNSQIVRLKRSGDTWSFLCPLSHQKTHRLYLRGGLFASRAAHALI